MVTSIEPWGVSNLMQFPKMAASIGFVGRLRREFRHCIRRSFMQDSKGEIRTLAGRPQIYGTPKDGVGWAAEFSTLQLLLWIMPN